MTRPPELATAVERLATFAVHTRADPPAAALADSTGRVLDAVGNSLAALALDDPAEPHAAILRIVARRGGTPEAAIIGDETRAPASAAALVNGTLAHALDFDDTHLPSVLHPSASVVPAGLAAAELADAGGAALLAAVAVGIEIVNRLGMAGYSRARRSSVFFDKGLHATSICGTVGAAATAGMLLGLDVQQLSSAMGIAASMGAGLIEANRTGGTVKRIHCGWAAHAGIEAALFAAEGITGPPTVIEGRFGFLRAYLDNEYDESAVCDGLGVRWELLRTVYKPYPSNHFTHPGIDCALALRAAGLRADDVEAAELGVAAASLRTIGEPRSEKIHPRSGYHAKFSGPYTVAAALLGDGLGLGVSHEDFAPAAVADPAHLALAARIQVVADDRCTEQFPAAFSAVLRVWTRSGRALEHRVDSSRGGPEHPLSFDELSAKFRRNAQRVLPAAAAEQLEVDIRGLAARPTVAGLLPSGHGR